MSKEIKISKSFKKKDKKEKLFVARPIRESLFDEDFRIIGTKEEIAKYVESQVEDGFDTRELKFKANSKQRLFLVEFHAGSSDGKEGIGGSNIFKNLREVKEWMFKHLEEHNLYAPLSIIFNIYPIYWLKSASNTKGAKEK